MSPQPTTTEPDPSEARSRVNEQLVLAMIHAVEERDMEALAACYHPDVEFVWPPGLPYGGTHRRAEVARMSEAYAAAWWPLQREPAMRRLDPRVIGSNEREVTAHYIQRGKDADGRLCEVEVIGIYAVTDGRVSRLQMFYFDPARAATFLATAARRDEHASDA